MLRIFDKNPRLLLLVIGIIIVSGSVAISLLPRQEDPRLTPRAARIITTLPGADPERVESLVTEKLEEELRSIQEIKELTSRTSIGVSFIGIELLDSVDFTTAKNTWARVRDKAEEAYLQMPVETTRPEFIEYDLSANAAIVALRWNGKGDPNYAILSRYMKELRATIDNLPGTQNTELFGEPNEEILVTLDPDAMTSLGLEASDVSQIIRDSDAKVSAGLMRTGSSDILLEVAGELTSLTRLCEIPITRTNSTNTVRLTDIAKIEKTIQNPPESKAVLYDQPAIAVGAQVRSDTRLDRWMGFLNDAIEEFDETLPQEISLDLVFEQNQYVSSRMVALKDSLIFAGASVLVVVFLMMGWRCALIVGVALPLVSLIVFSGMYFLGIPMHQISVTGLIISLGLLVDNAIVVVDEVDRRKREGRPINEAIAESIAFLKLPLAGSTATTVLSFSPIMLMGGPSGEFVGSIAQVAILAVVSSYVVALTVIASLSRFLLGEGKNGFLSKGIGFPLLTNAYRGALKLLFRYPVVGVVLGVLPSMLGMVLALELPVQFFPTTERNQFQVEIELPATSSIRETELVAKDIREHLLKDPQIENVHWFLGKSAPEFYYNVIPSRENSANYGQAIIDCAWDAKITSLLTKYEAELERRHPTATIIASQLKQGPAVEAPIEIRILGPDQDKLRVIGDQFRLVLSQTPHVRSTTSAGSVILPKISFRVDEQEAMIARLDQREIARKLSTTLEGVTGGSIVEGTEELPVRVRVSGERRNRLDKIASLAMLPTKTAFVGSNDMNDQLKYNGVPLSAISELDLKAESVSIERWNGQRIDKVNAYLDAGILPDGVQKNFVSRLEQSGFEIPAGYSFNFKGEDSRREEAVRSLMGSAVNIGLLMVAALLISVGSFRLTGLLFAIAGLSVGIGLGALWITGSPWGFMSTVGIMGMIGIAVNDSIVVLASLREERFETDRLAEQVVGNTRHVLATTLTTVMGFSPLIFWGGDFWRPVSITIGAGVLGATWLALIFIPSAYITLCKRSEPRNQATAA